MTTEISGLVEETKRLLGAVRSSLIRVGINLSQLKTGFPEKGKWGAFCEEEFGISESFASKLLTVNRVYIQEGGLAPEQLEGIDHEKLYLARNVEGTVEEKLSNAKTLTRREVKLNHKPHKGEFRSTCTICWIAEEQHP